MDGYPYGGKSFDRREQVAEHRGRAAQPGSSDHGAVLGHRGRGGRARRARRARRGGGGRGRACGGGRGPAGLGRAAGLRRGRAGGDRGRAGGDRGRAGGDCGRAGGDCGRAGGVRRGAVRATRCGCCTPRAPPGCPSRSCTATAGSCSSTSRRWPCTRTSARDDVFFWYTTTGWMMWNYLAGGLLVGAAVVLYDGSATHPGPDALWRLADQAGVTYVRHRRAVPAGLHEGRAAARAASTTCPGCAESARPGRRCRPRASAGSTTRWSPRGRSCMLGSFSGGTDLCTGFVGPCPLLPVRAGRDLRAGAWARRSRRTTPPAIRSPARWASW